MRRTSETIINKRVAPNKVHGSVGSDRKQRRDQPRPRSAPAIPIAKPARLRTCPGAGSAHYILTVRAQGHPNSDFGAFADYGIAHYAIDTYGSQQKSQNREKTEQKSAKPGLATEVSMVRSNGSICSIGEAGSTCKPGGARPQPRPSTLQKSLTSGSSPTRAFGYLECTCRAERLSPRLCTLVSATTAIISPA